MIHTKDLQKNLFAHHLGNKLISCKKQSVALVGSRGSGKTIYLKYFSHWMQLNKKIATDVNSLESVIFYWKPDTTFYRSISRRLDGKSARNLFSSMVTLEVTQELISFMINACEHQGLSTDRFLSDSKILQLLQNTFSEKGCDLEDLKNNLDI